MVAWRIAFRRKPLCDLAQGRVRWLQARRQDRRRTAAPNRDARGAVHDRRHRNDGKIACHE